MAIWYGHFACLTWNCGLISILTLAWTRKEHSGRSIWPSGVLRPGGPACCPRASWLHQTSSYYHPKPRKYATYPRKIQSRPPAPISEKRPIPRKKGTVNCGIGTVGWPISGCIFIYLDPSAIRRTRSPFGRLKSDLTMAPRPICLFRENVALRRFLIKSHRTLLEIAWLNTLPNMP